MNSRDFEKIDQFLSIVGKASLYEYYELDRGTAAGDVEATIKKKRSWAQGQQSNPKFRSEALWLIKNAKLVVKALVEEAGEYQSQITNKDQARNLEVLTLFMRGTLVDGILTSKKEDAIRHQGDQLGLPADVVSGALETMLSDLGAERSDDPAREDVTTDLPFVDHYAILDVAFDADTETLERGYRAKYRWARSLRDVKKASEIYAQLDEAWRVLKDAERRAAYDTRWQSQHGGGGNEPPQQPPQRPETKPPPRAAPPPRPEPQAQTEQPALAFRDRGVSDSIPPVRGLGKSAAPRPPEDLRGGRTLSLGAGAKGNEPVGGQTPKLVIDGPTTREAKGSGAPIPIKIKVRNAGHGRMSGRVFADRDWIEVSPSRLDPNVTSQYVQALVHPRRMPRNKAVSLVTVVADHGERKVVRIEAERRLMSPPVMAGIGLFVLFMLAVVIGLVFLRGNGGGADALPTRLVVFTDPAAGNIYVDGQMLSSDGTLNAKEGFPIGDPFELSIKLDGFKDYKEQVTVSDDQTQTVKVYLELNDPTDWIPKAGRKSAPLPEGALANLMTAREEALRTCLDQHGGQPGTKAEVTFIAYVAARGHIRGVHVKDSNFDAQPAERCIRRQLRSYRMPLLDDADYAEFSKTVSHTVRALPDDG